MIDKRKDLKEWLKGRLTPKRYQHSLGTEQTAQELAVIFGVDSEKAALAGLLHDNAKCIDYNDLLQLIQEKKFDIDDEIKQNHKIIHAYAGAYIAKKELNLQDEDVFNAIMYHTTGRLNMSLLEKIVYLADKIEPNTRDLEFRDSILMDLKKYKDIDKAISVCVGITLKSLIEQSLSINTQTIELWNSLI